MPSDIRFQTLGEKALIINDSRFECTRESIQKQWMFRNALEKQFSEIINDIVLSSTALTLFFKAPIASQMDDIQDRIFACKKTVTFNKHPVSYTIWKIPACFDKEFCVDLYRYFNDNESEVEHYLNAFLASELFVHYYGFLPGFFYLTGLDSTLQLPRKDTPDLKVEKGSVAVGGGYAGIYPQASPGGWQCIGKTPISIFNPSVNPPTFAQPGDRIVFERINKTTYLKAVSEGANTITPIQSIVINE